MLSYCQTPAAVDLLVQHRADVLWHEVNHAHRCYRQSEVRQAARTLRLFAAEAAA